MDVGIFGGSFNPPHLAHLIVAESVREQFGLREVWWMPSARPPHKEAAALASAAHRLAMTRRATEGNPAFRVSELEIERAGLSYTVNTIAALQQAHPATDFALLIGGDSLAAFGTWHRPGEIARRVPLLVYRRPGTRAAPPERFAERVHFAQAPLLEISGTEIRQRCRQGRSVRYLVPERVRAYIEKHTLYAS